MYVKERYKKVSRKKYKEVLYTFVVANIFEVQFANDMNHELTVILSNTKN